MTAPVSLDVKRLRQIADIMEAIEGADKPYLEEDPSDAQEEGLSFVVKIRWYDEQIGAIYDVSGNGEYMVELSRGEES